MEIEIAGDATAAVAAVKQVPGVHAASVVHQAGGRAQLRLEASTELRPAIVKALVEANLGVLRVDKATSRLESIFLRLTHGKEA